MTAALKKNAFEVEPSFDELKRDTGAALRIIDDLEKSLTDQPNAMNVNAIAAMLELIEQTLPNIRRASDIIEELDQQPSRSRH